MLTFKLGEASEARKEGEVCDRFPDKVAYKSRKDAARAIQKVSKRRDGRQPPKYFYRCAKSEGGCGEFHLSHWSRREAKLLKQEREAVA